MSAYAESGECSEICGGGEQIWSRECRIPEQNGLFGCVGEMEYVESCNEIDCDDVITTTAPPATTIAPTADFCASTIFDNFVENMNIASQLGAIDFALFDYESSANYQTTLTQFILAQYTGVDTVLLQSFLSSAVYANMMTRIEFMRYIYAELDIDSNTEICRLFDLPNYETAITQVYVETNFVYWSAAYVEFDWDLFTFGYQTCTATFYQQFVIDYVATLGLTDDQAYVLQQAVCNWDIDAWDFTFYSFESYISLWLTFYVDFPTPTYVSLVEGINTYLYTAHMEVVLVQIHILYDVVLACDFTITQGFYDEFAVLTELTDDILTQFATDYSWCVTVTFSSYLTCGVPDCAGAGLTNQLWDFSYDYGVFTYEAYQLFSYLSYAGLSAGYAYQIKWFYIYEFGFVWESDSTIVTYALYVRQFIEGKLSLLLAPLNSVGIIGIERLLYAPASGAALQRMFYFNYFSYLDFSILGRWYSEWTTSGFAFDLFFYTEWGIDLDIEIETAPLNIFQGCVMEFWNGLSSSWSLSADWLTGIQTWTFTLPQLAGGGVQTYLRSESGLANLRNFVTVDDVEWARFVDLSYTAEFSSLLFILELLAQFDLQLTTDFRPSLFQSMDFSLISWTSVRSYYTYDIYVTLLESSGATDSVITILTATSVYDVIFSAISVDLQEWKNVIYEIVQTHFGWFNAQSDTMFIKNVVKEVCRMLQKTPFGDTVVDESISWDRGKMYHMQYILSYLVTISSYNDYSEVDFHTNYLTSVKSWVVSVYSSESYAFADDESFITTVSTADLLAMDFFGYGQIGFAKYFFSYLTKLIYSKDSLSFDANDDARFDIGLLFFYIGGFEYVSVTFADGVTFEGYLASYTKTVYDKFDALGMSAETSVSMLVDFKKMAFDVNFAMMMTLSKMKKYIYSLGGDIKLMAGDVDFYSSTFYADYTVGYDAIYRVSVGGVPSTVTIDFKAQFTSVYSSLTFDWTVLDGMYLTYSSPIKLKLYTFYIWFVGMTEVESSELFSSADFTGFDADTDMIYDIISDNTPSTYSSTYSLDDYYNSFDFYQYVVQIEFFRYVEINLSSSSFRYFVAFTKFFNTFVCRLKL